MRLGARPASAERSQRPADTSSGTAVETARGRLEPARGSDGEAGRPSAVGQGRVTALLTVSDSSPGACQLIPAAGRGSSCWPAAARCTATRRAATASVPGPAGAARPLPRQRPGGPRPSGAVRRPGPVRSGPHRGRSGSGIAWRAGGSVPRGRRTGAASRARSPWAGPAGPRWAGGPPRRQPRAAPHRRPRRRPSRQHHAGHQHVGAATGPAAATAGTQLATAVTGPQPAGTGVSPRAQLASAVRAGQLAGGELTFGAVGVVSHDQHIGSCHLGAADLARPPATRPRRTEVSSSPTMARTGPPVLVPGVASHRSQAQAERGGSR
jgi:hypothetical protein